MGLKPRAKGIRHLFMPGDTVSGAIKKYNRYDVTEGEMKALLIEYRQINTDAIPRPGSAVMIPVLERHHAEVFKN